MELRPYRWTVILSKPPPPSYITAITSSIRIALSRSSDAIVETKFLIKRKAGKLYYTVNSFFLLLYAVDVHNTRSKQVEHFVSKYKIDSCNAVSPSGRTVSSLGSGLVQYYVSIRKGSRVFSSYQYEQQL